METVEKIKLEANIWRYDRGWGMKPLCNLGINSKSIGDFHLVGGTSDIEEFKTAIAVLSNHAPQIADILSYVQIDDDEIPPE